MHVWAGQRSNHWTTGQGPAFFHPKRTLFHNFCNEQLFQRINKMVEVEQKRKPKFGKFASSLWILTSCGTRPKGCGRNCTAPRSGWRLNRASEGSRGACARRRCCPEMPKVMETHLPDKIIPPKMVGSTVGVSNDKTFSRWKSTLRWLVGHYLDSSTSPVMRCQPAPGPPTPPASSSSRSQ